MANHLRLKIPRATGGPQYGVLQRIAYSMVIFVAAPLVVLTGLAMSPGDGGGSIPAGSVRPESETTGA